MQCLLDAIRLGQLVITELCIVGFGVGYSFQPTSSANATACYSEKLLFLIITCSATSWEYDSV